MKAANASGVDGTEEALRTSSGEPEGCLQNRDRRFAHPTAEELTRITFGKDSDLGARVQEVRNGFARLLNRGSSLE